MIERDLISAPEESAIARKGKIADLIAVSRGKLTKDTGGMPTFLRQVFVDDRRKGTSGILVYVLTDNRSDDVRILEASRRPDGTAWLEFRRGMNTEGEDTLTIDTIETSTDAQVTSHVSSLTLPLDAAALTDTDGGSLNEDEIVGLTQAIKNGALMFSKPFVSAYMRERKVQIMTQQEPS